MCHRVASNGRDTVLDELGHGCTVTDRPVASSPANSINLFEHTRLIPVETDLTDFAAAIELHNVDLKRFMSIRGSRSASSVSNTHKWDGNLRVDKHVVVHVW